MRYPTLPTSVLFPLSPNISQDKYQLQWIHSIETIFYPLHCDISFHAWDIQLCMFPPSQKMLQDKYYLQWIHQVTKYTQHSGRPAMLLHFMSHIENINEFQMLENFVQVQLKWHILFRNYNWIHLFTVTY